MVGGGRLVKEFGGRRRRLGRGFRLGVGVKSLVGSASAWSVKGGFLLLPAMGERGKQKVLTLPGEQKRLLSTTLVFFLFTVDTFRPCLGFCVDFSPALSISSTLSHFCIDAGCVCVCACV